MAAAAWSWVEKMLQLVQVTSAPREVRVSMRTAVWMAAVCQRRLKKKKNNISNLGDQLTHVQATGDTSTLEGLLRTILAADSHKTGHLNLGQLNLAATESGQGLPEG